MRQEGGLVRGCKSQVARIGDGSELRIGEAGTVVTQDHQDRKVSQDFGFIVAGKRDFHAVNVIGI